MNRYVTSPVIREKITDVPKHRTSFNPAIARENGDLFIRTVAGDRLDNLASEFYQDVSLWWIIATANQLGKGSFAVPPGTKLRIPQNTTDIIDQYRDFNQLRR
tara:strand:- start:1152 stop:1460 length:309 start_codon:yes stop_codon:yes gene_type:complete